MNIGDLVPWKSNELSERERTTDPFVALRRDMNRLFDNFLDDDWLATWPNLRTERFSPRVNVTENDTAITVSAELPGISEEDVDITLQRDALTIKGEKKAEHEEKEPTSTASNAASAALAHHSAAGRRSSIRTTSRRRSAMAC